MFAKLICRFLGHKWKRNKENLIKSCKRCGHIHQIKKRTPKP